MAGVRTGMQRVVASVLFVSVSVSSGCVSNPAKHPTPNDVEVTLEGKNEDLSFKRGDEELDEQDYYELLGDNDAKEEMESHRASGVRRQGIGTVLMAIGVGVLGSTIYAYTKKDELVDGEVPSWVWYTGMAGGAILAVGGQRLRASGKERVRQKPVLDEDRATEALNMKRYGSRTVGAGIIKTLEWDVHETYCVSTGTTFGPIVAKDQSGREIDLAAHEDWVSVTAKPKGAVRKRAGGYEVEAAPLDDLDRKVRITVKVKDNALTKTYELAPSFACSARLSFTPERGEAGARGPEGAKGELGGSPGGAGGAGGNGPDAPDVTAEAAYVTYKGQRLLAVAASGGGKQRFALVDAEQGSIGIDVEGGTGGEGGEGGRGGALDKHAAERGGCHHLESGDGGTGGPGGNGGRGGTLQLRGPKAAIAAVTLSVSGGGAGAGGSGGDYGSTGFGCVGSPGKRGDSGPKGSAGTSGKGTRDVAAPGELSALQEMLAKNPALQLEGGDDGGKKKKR